MFKIMEHPPLHESVTEPYEYRYVDPVQHVPLLENIAAADTPITESWLQRLDQAIVQGSVRIHQGTSLSQASAIKAARQEFADLLGLHAPDHQLYPAFSKAMRLRAGSLLPKNLYGTLHAMQEITGDASGTIVNEPLVLLMNHTAIPRRFAYMSRVAGALGWQGDVRKVIHQEPGFLLRTERQLGVIARIAAEHGTSENRTMSTEEVASLLPHRPVENQIVALLLHNEGFRLGAEFRGKLNGLNPTKRRLQEMIYNAAAQPDQTERIRPRVLRAFFRYQTPDTKTQEAYPQIKAYIPAHKRLPEVIQLDEMPPPRVVTGRESWLKHTARPNRNGRRAWLERINRDIERGSQTVKSMKPGNPEYERVLKHRLDMFVAFGWADPKHPLFEAYDAYSRRREALFYPKNAITILNMISDRGANVATVLKKNFSVLAHAPDSVEQRLAVVEAKGLDVVGFLENSSYMLRLSLDSLVESIDSRKDRGNIRLRAA